MTKLVAVSLIVAVAFTIWAVATRTTSQAVDHGTTQVPRSSTSLMAAPAVLNAQSKELVELEGWLQSDVSSLAELRGHVVVVQFWTFGCINCKRTLDNMRHIYATHGDRADFEVVGVHSPEFKHEAVVANIEQAVLDLNISWPIALDTDKANFYRWQGSPAYWPRTFVLDRDGQIRFDHIGEGGYEELQQTVAYLLTQEA